ncbi:MAG: hypothetical protein ACO1PM_07240 [Acidovorax sp.]
MAAFQKSMRAISPKRSAADSKKMEQLDSQIESTPAIACPIAEQTGKY